MQNNWDKCFHVHKIVSTYCVLSKCESNFLSFVLQRVTTSVQCTQGYPCTPRDIGIPIVLRLVCPACALISMYWTVWKQSHRTDAQFSHRVQRSPEVLGSGSGRGVQWTGLQHMPSTPKSTKKIAPLWCAFYVAFSFKNEIKC